MLSVNMHEAKTQLSKLVEQAVKGETFIISKAGKPLVKVIALDAPVASQRLGFMAGELTIPADFNHMGTAEIADFIVPTLSGNDKKRINSMFYSDFTIKQAQSEFNLDITEQFGFFSNIAPSMLSDYFTETLIENIPLAVAINTEKAKSELIIANVLIEVRKKFARKISFFSGVEFNVNKDKGLNGYCDFIMSLSTEQLFIKSPVIALVEAKNENIMSGLGQCSAEMIAARMFNEQEGNNIAAIYGAVTSGIFWKFIKLLDNKLYIDLKDYSIEDHPEKIIGILSAMIRQEA